MKAIPLFFGITSIMTLKTILVLLAGFLILVALFVACVPKSKLASLLIFGSSLCIIGGGLWYVLAKL